MRWEKIVKQLEFILKEQLISIIRVGSSKDIDKIVASLYQGGIRVIEITLNTPGALDAIRKISNMYPDVLVGAGTVLNANEAKEAIQAGAQFLLSPTLSQSTVQIGVKEDIPVIPGVMTPTEALAAYEYGAEIVKVFPVRSLGVEFAADLAGPLPFIKLAAVGGVSIANAGDFLQAGWHVLGIGGQLVNHQLIAENNFAEIERRAKKLIQIRDEIK